MASYEKCQKRTDKTQVGRSSSQGVRESWDTWAGHGKDQGRISVTKSKGEE